MRRLLCTGSSSLPLLERRLQCEIRGCLSVSITTQRNLSGGWKIPKQADTATRVPAERVKIQVPDKEEPLEICLRQRFTMAPGGQAGGGTSDDKTGTWVWPTTRILLDYLLHEDILTRMRNDSHKKTLRILELGAGCGLLGMALAASDLNVHVTLTDHAGNIDCLRQNLDLNGALIQDRAVAATLCWGKGDEMDTLLGDYDLVLGSDLIYDSNAHSVLVETLNRLGNGSSIYLAYPFRNHSSEQDFLQLLSHYFSLKTVELNKKNGVSVAICEAVPFCAK